MKTGILIQIMQLIKNLSIFPPKNLNQNLKIQKSLSNPLVECQLTGIDEMPDI